MTGLGILLGVIGAILYFAVDFSVVGIELSTVGIILMVAGAVALIVGLMQMSNRRSRGQDYE